MLKRLILTALQIVGVILTVFVSFAYGYVRAQPAVPLVVLCGMLMGGVYWATLDLESALVPWGDRLLGAAFTACAFVLWGRLHPTRVSTRRHRHSVTS